MHDSIRELERPVNDPEPHLRQLLRLLAEESVGSKDERVTNSGLQKRILIAPAVR